MAVTKVVMPKLSEAMETGKLLRWIKQEGDRISGGDIVAEIETDKADIELEAFGAGVLRKVLIAPGAVVPVGSLIAVIADPGDDIGALVGGATSTPVAAGPVPSAPPVAPAPRSAVPAAPAAAPAPVASTPFAAGGGRVKASPLAKKLAQQAGVDLTLVKGTGPGGRIIQRDIEAVAATRSATPPAATPPVVTAPAAPPLRPAPAAVRPAGEYEDQPLSQIRAAIARQMAQSKGPVPHFYVTTEIAMERAVALREELLALPGAPKVTFTDLIARACVVTLLKHPGINASLHGEAIRRYRAVHLGLAVALDEGLITPVLRDADQKSVMQIAAETRDLVERTRARKLRAQELSGATFTVSNLGMFPVDEFSAIINPPEGAILAVGAIVEKPVAVNGQLAVGKRMRVTLSCDHRVMDGAMAARFLADLKAALELPLSLLV